MNNLTGRQQKSSIDYKYIEIISKKECKITIREKDKGGKSKDV